MKLIFLYGPPGVGKLTVATELAALTAYRLFDNHKSIDCVTSVFDFGTRSFAQLRDAIRDLVLEEAAARDVDLIFTMVYEHPDDLPYVARMMDPIERHGGEALFVQLTCDAATNEERLVAQTRTNKLNDLDVYRRIKVQKDLWSPIPGRNSLRIDNTDLSAANVALQIAEYYGLPKVGAT